MALSLSAWRAIAFSTSLAVFSFACSGEQDTPSPSHSADAHVAIFTGGVIYTGMETAPTAEAVAVSDGVIAAVGARNLVQASAGENVEIIDLEGAAMYPGFVDSHVHLLAIGLRELELNLEGVASIEELVSIVRARVDVAGEDELVYGRGWIETGWPEGRMPNRDDLDPVSGATPVVLGRADGHAMVVNSAALAAAGINEETPDPGGGKIERDEADRATGVLIDNAMALVDGLLAAPSEDKKRQAYGEASNVYAGYGWTGVHNMSVAAENIPLMEAYSNDGLLDLRVYNAVEPEDLDWLIKSGHRQNENGRVITRAVKLYIDGALGSRGALLSEPYSDRPETSGLMLMQKDYALDHYNRALAAGVQVATHAIGDLGNKTLLDWYEDVFAANPNATDLRWRDEHAQILHTQDIPRFAELGVIPSMQPSHAIGDMFFAPDRLGPDRLDGAYAWRSLIDAGAIIAGGSDAPVERGDPRIEFYAAVARRGLNGYQDENWRPDQAATREDALKMFTIWPAYAAFQEDALGTIEPGKRADFTVFSKDIMTVPAEEILSVETVMTVVDGEIVYKREN